MVVAPTTAVPISTGLAVALKVLPAPSFSSSKSFDAVEIHVNVEVLLDLRLDVGHLLDQREFIDGLCVVGHRAVGIDRDGHRPHAEEAEGNQAEGKHRCGNHGGRHAQTHLAEEVGNRHQSDHRQPQVIRGKVSGDKTGKDSERCAAFFGRSHHFIHVAGFHRSEDLDQFRNQRSRQRSAGDDRSQLPPLRGIAPKVGDDETRNNVGGDDRNNRSQPNQPGERGFKIHFVRVAVAGLRDGAIDEIGQRAGDQHHDAHHENPHQQLHLDGGIFDAQQNEGDQRDAGDTISFETIGRRSDRVAGIVAGAIGNHARVAGIVFFNLEDDLHQIGTDVGNLGEDAAGDTQRGRAQRLADGESDEARAGIIARHEEQDEEHDQQFDRDQHHANRHAGFERNLINRVRLAGQRSEGRPRIREGVDANSEPRHAVATRDSHQTEGQNDDHPGNFEMPQKTKIEHDDGGNEGPQQHQELALRDQVSLTGFVNQFRDFAHGAVHGQVLQTHENNHAEAEAENAEQQPDHQQAVPVHTEK